MLRRLISFYFYAVWPLTNPFWLKWIGEIPSQYKEAGDGSSIRFEWSDEEQRVDNDVVGCARACAAYAANAAYAAVSAKAAEDGY